MARPARSRNGRRKPSQQRKKLQQNEMCCKWTWKPLPTPMKLDGPAGKIAFNGLFTDYLVDRCFGLTHRFLVLSFPLLRPLSFLFSALPFKSARFIISGTTTASSTSFASLTCSHCWRHLTLKWCVCVCMIGFQVTRIRRKSISSPRPSPAFSNRPLCKNAKASFAFVWLDTSKLFTFTNDWQLRWRFQHLFLAALLLPLDFVLRSSGLSLNSSDFACFAVSCWASLLSSHLIIGRALASHPFFVQPLCNP